MTFEHLVSIGFIAASVLTLYVGVEFAAIRESVRALQARLDRQDRDIDLIGRRGVGSLQGMLGKDQTTNEQLERE